MPPVNHPPFSHPPTPPPPDLTLPPPLLCSASDLHAAVYFAFASIGVAAVSTIYAIVPETKGKTLEEIEALWAPVPADAQAGGVAAGSGRSGAQKWDD